MLEMECRDARAWGPPLRCFAPSRLVEEFARDVAASLPPFVLYGSGDFHHLAGVFLRNVRSPVTLVSFDNHPDWDRRPPRWACGGWINRALDFPHIRRVSIWGLGNFELNRPSRWFGSRDPRIEVHGWAERYPGVPGTMTRESWRSEFASFAAAVEGKVYVTVDLDCIRDEEMVTNWENGLFTADDVAWAIAQLPRVIGGDVCGAYSPPVYARRRQRFAAEWDRPKREPVDLEKAREVNMRSVMTVWKSLRQQAPG